MLHERNSNEEDEVNMIEDGDNQEENGLLTGIPQPHRPPSALHERLLALQRLVGIPVILPFSICEYYVCLVLQ